jgi:thioredoxin 1
MAAEPTREEINHLAGPVVLEFGASWCPHCQAIQSELSQSLQQAPQIRHIKIEDGRGKPLGRSFRVKLWPTLVLMRDGQVIRQLVRPADEEIRKAVADLADSKSLTSIPVSTNVQEDK